MTHDQHLTVNLTDDQSVLKGNDIEGCFGYFKYIFCQL